LLAKADGAVIDGHLGLLAAQRKGIKELPFIIPVTTPLTALPPRKEVKTNRLPKRQYLRVKLTRPPTSEIGGAAWQFEKARE
jgi:hypothetical protein